MTSWLDVPTPIGLPMCPPCEALRTLNSLREQREQRDREGHDAGPSGHAAEQAYALGYISACLGRIAVEPVELCDLHARGNGATRPVHEARVTAGNCADGSERGRGSVRHAVPRGRGYNRAAVCGARPRVQWDSRIFEVVTCKRCCERLQTQR